MKIQCTKGDREVFDLKATDYPRPTVFAYVHESQLTVEQATELRDGLTLCLDWLADTESAQINRALDGGR
jgi:hypothetical protein